MNAPGAARERWRLGYLLEVPYRVGFLLAMVVLGASALWWAGVQLHRIGALAAFPYAIAPTLAHSAVMSFGFMPLFFAGFLFTAGPRWLGVPGPSARQIAPALAAQALGWLLWLAGAMFSGAWGIAGLALACVGLVDVTRRFWKLIAASPVPDRMHPLAVGVALVAGCLSLAGFTVALAFGGYDVARSLLLTGLWTFVVSVFLIVAHRMIPFFTASALPFMEAWRPAWILGFMLGLALLQAGAVWIDTFFGGAAGWLVVRGTVELASGLLLAALAVAWGLVKSLRIRLLAMLHLGFVWLGVSIALGGAAHLLGALADRTLLPLASLHALTIGCLGSLMLAMVTRVTCGHGGRPLVADNLVWLLFWLLQAAALARIAATLPVPWAQALLTSAAVLWAAIMLTWGVRYGYWYGRPFRSARAAGPG